ncbi:hypothetical protein BOTBODRAFT_58161 [Botryobasidium botryosum FD-172 SS1]|uniref:Uncharacterized protein n=1 Tax=Botryobasidium botryosum (strain FD-172 SS1) TaxID=930990 RepID=A0A067MF56_BOTB1|nr:hypothetical protein BOTBODRAFT_58161 [Botryobasidium botryosum FD-172 SS1]
MQAHGTNQIMLQPSAAEIMATRPLGDLPPPNLIGPKPSPRETGNVALVSHPREAQSEDNRHTNRRPDPNHPVPVPPHIINSAATEEKRREILELVKEYTHCGLFSSSYYNHEPPASQ